MLVLQCKLPAIYMMPTMYFLIGNEEIHTVRNTDEHVRSKPTAGGPDKQGQCAK